MKKLTQKEQNEILNLSTRFINIHSELVESEKQINYLEQKSSDLLSELEVCRETEKKFCKKMSDRYGEGELDPISMTWKSKIKEIK
jgi:hypothetical protein